MPLLYENTASLSEAVTGGGAWRQFVTGESIVLEYASYKLASCTATSCAIAKLAAWGEESMFIVLTKRTTIKEVYLSL
ncbi:hypothetical protein ACFSRY_12235 [Pontibacter locisalis]|uniref:Uncharacterized protein n=1 Tax=Pontibacter locisalis TaxID=1719035 RepID=A0ABW5IMJ9_9BACT